MRRTTKCVVALGLYGYRIALFGIEQLPLNANQEVGYPVVTFTGPAGKFAN
jgi:hypothetical protein